jgi:hypothetical protein
MRPQFGYRGQRPVLPIPSSASRHREIKHSPSRHVSNVEPHEGKPTNVRLASRIASSRPEIWESTVVDERTINLALQSQNRLM